MKCALRGNFIETVKRAEYLRNYNISVYMENGEIVFPSRKSFVEALLLLHLDDLISDEELLMNMKRYKTDTSTNQKILKGENSVCILESDDKFLRFSRVQDTDDFYLIAVDETEKKDKDIIKFSFQKGTQCYDIIDTLYRVDNSPIIQSEKLKDLTRVEIEKNEDNYTLNVIRVKDKTYVSPYTTILSSESSSSNSRMKYLYNELGKISKTDSNVSTKIK